MHLNRRYLKMCLNNQNGIDMAGKKGIYSEPLASGGELVVTSDNWEIKYYFSGPDLRHSGEFVHVWSTDIDKYIIAYRNNFQKYQTLKETLPPDGDFKTVGECRMNIGVGAYHYGVTIGQWYNHLIGGCFPIKKLEDLEKVIADYEYCKQRAKEIKSKLFLD